jgi:hypothetical protein
MLGKEERGNAQRREDVRRQEAGWDRPQLGCRASKVALYLTHADMLSRYLMHSIFDCEYLGDYKHRF